MRHTLALSALATFACEATPPTADDGGWRPEWPEFEVRYETDHVRVAPSFEQPICQGSLDAMERHVLMVADALEIEPERVTVFWFNDGVQGANLDEPRGDCFPCFKYGAVYSTWGSMMHELVHGTVSPVLGRSDVTLSEGVANGFDGAPVTEPAGGPSLPSQLIGDTKQGGDLFFRWLLDVRGPDVIKELFAVLPRGIGAEEGIAVFGEVLGEDLLAVEAEFLATTPKVYPAPRVCDGLPEVAWEEETWSIDTKVDCSASNVFGPTDPGDYSYDPDPYDFVAVVMNVPAEIVGRELVVVRDPDLPDAFGVPCIDDPIDDPDLAKTTTFTSVLSGYTLPLARYRIEVPAGPDGRASLRLTVK